MIKWGESSLCLNQFHTSHQYKPSKSSNRALHLSGFLYNRWDVWWSLRLLQTSAGLSFVRWVDWAVLCSDEMAQMLFIILAAKVCYWLDVLEAHAQENQAP